MFNLFVSWEEDAFESLAWVIEGYRFTEFTDEKLIKRYSKLTPKTRETIFSIPTLFLREALQGQARVGYIRDVRPRGNDLLIEFVFDDALPPFPAEKLSKRALTRLDIRSGEMGRTHWAIKNEDLLTILTSEGLIPRAAFSAFAPPARQQLVAPNPPVTIADSAAAIPTAFMSYSWESDEHKEWVLALATRLRADGINALLDRWDLRPGSDKTLFMEQGVVDSTFVLIVCTPTYAKKADKRDGGVGYEAMVITGQLAKQVSQDRFIPLLKTGTWETSTPVWLQAKLGVDLSDEPYSSDAYGELLRRLHDEWHSAPQIGPRPAFKQRAQEQVDSSPLSIAHQLTDASPIGSTLRISTNHKVSISRLEYLTGDNVRISEQKLDVHGKEVAIPLPHEELLKIWNLTPQDGTRLVLRLHIHGGGTTQIETIYCVMKSDFQHAGGGLTLFFRLVG